MATIREACAIQLFLKSTGKMWPSSRSRGSSIRETSPTVMMDESGAALRALRFWSTEGSISRRPSTVSSRLIPLLESSSGPTIPRSTRASTTETGLSIEAPQRGLIHRSLRAQVCKRRIFEATLDARLIALDAATGVPCAEFGSSGQVNLRNVPGYQHAKLGEHMRGWYHMTSPPVTIDDMVIVGSAIDDNNRVDMPSGVVRAFDARTGALRWSWDPIPQDAPNYTFILDDRGSKCLVDHDRGFSA